MKTASLTLLLALLAGDADAACVKEPARDGRWWSYRLIGGQKCWYAGKPKMRAARRQPKEQPKDQAQHKQDTIAVKRPKEQARQGPAPDAGWEHIYQIRERRDGQ